MSMVGCLFCKRKLRLYKLSMAYSETSHPVKHYIIEFLGPCEEFLDDDYGVCDDCVLVVNKLVYIKKCMYWILIAARQGEYNNTPNLKFSHVYKRFLENLTKLSYENVEIDDEVEEHSTEAEASVDTNSESSGGGGDGEAMNEQEVSQSLDNAGIVQNGDLQWSRMQWNLMPSSHKCTDCSMEYDTLKELTKHKVDHHEMSLIYICSDCSEEKFVSEEDLQLHRHEMHEPQALQCFLCSARLKTVEELQKHIKEHTGHSSYPCSYCDLFFSDAQTCRTHMQENHRENRQGTARDEVEEADTDQSNSNLLRELNSSPYDERRETQYAHRYGTPVTNREVQRLLNRKRRKKRGHNWTRRKGWRSKSRISMYSEPIMRAGSRYSSGTGYSEYYSERGYSDNEDDHEVAGNMRYAGAPRNGILRNNRAHSCWTEPTADTNYDDVGPVYECGSCNTEFDTLKEMTEHKVLEHCMLANYVCYECYDAKFVSPEDLKLHNDQIHPTLISHCFLCSLELRTVEDLQRHLREHNNSRDRSYRCNYCDLSFLNRRTYRAHRRDAHKGQRGRFRQLKKCTILDRINRSRSRSPVRTPVVDDTYNNQVIWRLQKRPSVPSLSALCTDVLKRFYCGNVDVDDLISETYVTERRREDNREDELLDYVCEDALEVQSEMTIACNGSSDNGLDIDNLPVENEESELIEIDNVAEVDVYTFVGSDEESRSEPECLRIGRFRSFTNKIEENELDDSGSTDTSSGRSSLLVNCQDDSKSSNHPKRGHS